MRAHCRSLWCCRQAQRQMRAGAPFIVRNCRKRMNWDPSCMNRALKDTSPVDLEVQHPCQESYGSTCFAPVVACVMTAASHWSHCLVSTVQSVPPLTCHVKHVQVVNCREGFGLQLLKRHTFFECYKDQVLPAVAFSPFALVLWLFCPAFMHNTTCMPDITELCTYSPQNIWKRSQGVNCHR